MANMTAANATTTAPGPAPAAPAPAPAAPAPAPIAAVPTPRAELMGVLTVVDELVVRVTNMALMAQDLQGQVASILDRTKDKESNKEKEFADDLWVRGKAKSPTQVEAEHVNVLDGTRAWWVVYVGREPGLYTTIEEADMQIKGVPNQQYRRKASKQEALNYYKQMYERGDVAKWIQVVE